MTRPPNKSPPSGLTKRSSGQATIEYLYVIPILLILLLGTLQFVFIYEAKQTLNYATFVATRAGALQNGSMPAIQDGLYSGFAPLFTHSTKPSGQVYKDQQALKDARAMAKMELSNSKLALITIVNPTPGAFAGFVGSNSQAPLDMPNDNLMYRDPADLQDGMNIQDANILKVRVTYCVRLVVPIVNRVIFSFYNSALNPSATKAKIDSSTYQGTSIAAPELLKAGSTTAATGLCIGDTSFPYRLPVTSEAVVRMQSPFGNPNPGKANPWVAP